MDTTSVSRNKKFVKGQKNNSDNTQKYQYNTMTKEISVIWQKKSEEGSYTEDIPPKTLITT